MTSIALEFGDIYFNDKGYSHYIDTPFPKFEVVLNYEYYLDNYYLEVIDLISIEDIVDLIDEDWLDKLLYDLVSNKERIF